MIKPVNSNNNTNFALDGKSGSLLQLISEKKTQALTRFSGMRSPRVHRLMMLNLTAVLAVCRSPDVQELPMTWPSVGIIMGACTSTLLKE